MSAIKEKSVLILEYEEKFARLTAIQVIESPKLSLWVILIPIILVYHLYQHQKCRDGRKQFAENYLISRKRAVNEAISIVENGKAADIEKLVSMAELPDTALKPYAEWLSVLVEHYADLLGAKGENFDELVRSAYRNHTNFLLFLNRLNQAEKALNTALKPHISAESEIVDKIVSRIEQYSEILRRNNAEKIFA